MEIFKQLNKKGYKHYYEGTIEELDSMNKDNPHLHSEIMQVVMWLYEKYGIWIWVEQNGKYWNGFNSVNIKPAKSYFRSYNMFALSPTEAYEAAIEYCLNNLI